MQIVPIDGCKAIHELYEARRDKRIWTYLPKTMETYDEMKSFVEETLFRKEAVIICLFEKIKC